MTNSISFSCYKPAVPSDVGGWGVSSAFLPTSSKKKAQSEFCSRPLSVNSRHVIFDFNMFDIVASSFASQVFVFTAL